MTPRETTAAAQLRSSMTVPPDLVMGLLGSADGNLRALESSLSAEVHVRGNTVNLSGSAADVALAERVISELIAIVAGRSDAVAGCGAAQRRHDLRCR